MMICQCPMLGLSTSPPLDPMIHSLRIGSRSLVSEPPVGPKTGSINAVSLSRVAAQAQPRVSPTKFSLNGGGISIITIWLFNSSPWKDPPILKNGKPSISMGHLYHGYVNHNQRL